MRFTAARRRSRRERLQREDPEQDRAGASGSSSPCGARGADARSTGRRDSMWAAEEVFPAAVRVRRPGITEPVGAAGHRGRRAGGRRPAPACRHQSALPRANAMRTTRSCPPYVTPSSSRGTPAGVAVAAMCADAVHRAPEPGWAAARAVSQEGSARPRSSRAARAAELSVSATLQASTGRAHALALLPHGRRRAGRADVARSRMPRGRRSSISAWRSPRPAFGGLEQRCSPSMSAPVESASDGHWRLERRSTV